MLFAHLEAFLGGAGEVSIKLMWVRERFLLSYLPTYTFFKGVRGCRCRSIN